jgi:site-specific DNA recombinase
MTFMVGESGTARNKETYRYYKCLSAKRKRGCDKKAVKKKWIEDISTPVSFLYSFSFFHLVA